MIFALNLYALCTANPVAVMSTFMPRLYYNGEYKTWWEKNGGLVLLDCGSSSHDNGVYSRAVHMRSDGGKGGKEIVQLFRNESKEWTTGRA